MFITSVIIFLVLFFFCKQKTAYEMRISDCSSYVCSSDLMENRPRHRNVISIEKGSVAIAFVREALDGVVRRGLDPADFLRRAAIAPEQIGRASCRERVCQYV